MKKSYYLLMLSMLAITSCRQTPTSSDLPVISHEDATATLYLSDIVDYSFVKLKTPANTYINDVYDVQLDDSLMFIQSSGSGDSRIDLFSRKGEYITKIGDVGRARNEYLHIDFWALDRFNKEVYIGGGREIKRYNYDGAFVGNIDYNDNILNIGNMFVVSNNHFVFQRDIPSEMVARSMPGFEAENQRKHDKLLESQSRYIVTDKSLNLLSNLSDRGLVSEDAKWSLRPLLYNTNADNNVYANDLINDTLYQLHDTEFVPKMLIHTQKIEASDIDIDRPVYQIVEAQRGKYNIGAVSSRLMVGEYIIENKHIINIKENTIHHLKIITPKDTDIAFFHLYSQASYNNTLVSLLNPSSIEPIVKNKRENNIKYRDDVELLLRTTTLEDNPVVFFYEFK